MSESAEGKRSKERSPAFPFISLERALDRARSFYAEEKRGAAPLSRAVMHWKYSPGSSGALQTIAALKQYGLLDDVGGSGANRQFRLSELALRILVDQREDTSEREANIRFAALCPAVAAEVFNRWPEGLPSEGTLHHFLVIDKKFAEAAATSAVKIIKENQQFASISGADMQSPDEDIRTETMMESAPLNLPTPRRDAVGRDIAHVAGSPMARTVAHQPATVGARRLLGHLGVDITIHFSEAPSKEVFEYLARYCNFEKDNVPSLESLRSPVRLKDASTEPSARAD